MRTIRKLIIKQRSGQPDEEEQINQIITGYISTLSGGMISLINPGIKGLHKSGHPARK
jgi:hypothetical protein